jgi:uncharacterized coiled-coil protein SlyX
MSSWGAVYVRLTGLVFQVLGLIIVAKGLRDTRKLFNRPGWTTRAAKWWHEFPSFGPKNYVLDVEPASLHLSGDVDAVVIRNPAQGLSIEHRVVQLEGRLAEQEHLISQMQTKIAAESRLQKKALQSESRSRASADQILEKKLEEFAAGGLHLETIGLFWILTEVFLATASVEIAWLLRRLM